MTNFSSMKRFPRPTELPESAVQVGQTWELQDGQVRLRFRITKITPNPGSSDRVFGRRLSNGASVGPFWTRRALVQGFRGAHLVDEAIPVPPPKRRRAKALKTPRAPVLRGPSLKAPRLSTEERARIRAMAEKKFPPALIAKVSGLRVVFVEAVLRGEA